MSQKNQIRSQSKDRLKQKYPECVSWTNNNGQQIQELITPKKEMSKNIPQKRSYSSQSQPRASKGNPNQMQLQSPQASSIGMRSPQSQISTQYQSQPSNTKQNSSLQRSPQYMNSLEKDYQRKNYDNIKKYLDLAKVNRRVTANDVKKLAAEPLKGFRTNIKEALTMEGIQKRIIKETELKYYDYTSQINLPITCAREEENLWSNPQPRTADNGRYSSQMKLIMDDASQIVNLPGTVRRELPENIPQTDKQVERYLLPSTISEYVAKNNPQTRYIYEERGKKLYDDMKNQNTFNITMQHLQKQNIQDFKESNPLAYKKNASTLRIY